MGDEQFPPDLSGPRFVALACRVVSYGGVMTDRALAQVTPEPSQAPSVAYGGPELTSPSGNGARRTVPSTPAMLQGDPILSQYVEYG